MNWTVILDRLHAHTSLELFVFGWAGVCVLLLLVFVYPWRDRQ